MPLILVEKVEWNKISKAYYVSLRSLQLIIPHLKTGDSLGVSITEVRNERRNLVKKFKPKKEIMKVSRIPSFYTLHHAEQEIDRLSLSFPPDRASDLNIGNNYYVCILITEHNGKPLLPFELKCIGPGSEEVAKNFDKIDVSLMSISLPELQEAVNYLLEANSLDKEGRIEDVRTNLRKALESLEKIRGKIKPLPGKETEEFGRLLTNLIHDIKGFVSYGGPHLGPTPKPTTEMVFNMTVEILKMISQNILEENISIIGEKNK